MDIYVIWCEYIFSEKGPFCGYWCARKREKSFRERERGFGIGKARDWRCVSSSSISIYPSFLIIQPPQHHTNTMSLSSLCLFPSLFFTHISRVSFSFSFSFRSERLSSQPWLPSASSRSSRTCRKTHQLLAALVSFFLLHFTPRTTFFCLLSLCREKVSFFFSGFAFVFVQGLNKINLYKAHKLCVWTVTNHARVK